MIRESNRSEARDGAKLAAHEIMRLINSRPHSPQHDEIVAIIERLVTRPLQTRHSVPSGLDEYGPDLTTFSS